MKIIITKIQFVISPKIYEQECNIYKLYLSNSVAEDFFEVFWLWYDEEVKGPRPGYVGNNDGPHRHRREEGAPGSRAERRHLLVQLRGTNGVIIFHMMDYICLCSVWGEHISHYGFGNYWKTNFSWSSTIENICYWELIPGLFMST